MRRRVEPCTRAWAAEGSPEEGRAPLRQALSKGGFASAKPEDEREGVWGSCYIAAVRLSRPERVSDVSALRKGGVLEKGMPPHVCKAYFFRYVAHDGPFAVFCSSRDDFVFVHETEEDLVWTWPDWSRVVAFLPLLGTLQKYPWQLWAYALDPWLLTECRLINLLLRAMAVKALNPSA